MPRKRKFKEADEAEDDEDDDRKSNTSSDDDDDDDDDGSSNSKDLLMDFKSPYEKFEDDTLEDDVSCFKKFHKLMKPMKKSPSSCKQRQLDLEDDGPNPKLDIAVKKWLLSRQQKSDSGSKWKPSSDDVIDISQSFYQAYYQILKCGMGYSSHWVIKNQDGVNNVDAGTTKVNHAFQCCREIPKSLLLLCIVPYRIAVAEEVVLKTLSHDLFCSRNIQRALKAWNMTKEYPNLVLDDNPNSLPKNRTLHYTYMKQKPQCYKCEIFVARTYVLCEFMEQDLDDTLRQKVKVCLDVMNNGVKQVTQSKSEDLPKKKSRPSKQLTDVKEQQAADLQKRGRHRKESIVDKKQRIPMHSKKKKTFKATKKDWEVIEISSSATATESGSPISNTETATSSVTHSSLSLEVVQIKKKSTGKRHSSIRNNKQSPKFLPPIMEIRQQYDHINNSIDMFACQQLQVGHGQLGKALEGIHKQIVMKPKILRKQWEEEIRQEIFEELKEQQK